MGARAGVDRRVLRRRGADVAPPARGQAGGAMSQAERPLPTIGVVIPALNEEATIADQVAEVLAVAGRPISRRASSGSSSSTTGAPIVPRSAPRRPERQSSASRRGMVAPASRVCWRPVMSISSSRWMATAAIALTNCRCCCSHFSPVRPISSSARARSAPMSRVRSCRSSASATGWRHSLRLLYGVHVTDIGPFRVIRRDLLGLGMREMTYGWSVEMIARAARNGRVRGAGDHRLRAGGESK